MAAAAGPEIERLIALLAKLPGLGPRSARRATLTLLKKREQLLTPLAQALADAAARVRTCQVCGALDTTDPCAICADHGRDGALLCVVEEVGALWAMERAGAFRGRYHVLGGLISPLRGVGPDQLRVRELLKRLEDSRIQEIVLATNPTLDGEATAAWLARILEPLGLRTTRIGLGLPIGSDLEYADDLTLDRALEGRRPL